jgi:diaminopimelate epimerase
VKITKMSGAGNDFVVLGPEEAALLGEGLSGWARGVCRRGLSVGADGVIVVQPSGNARVRMRFLNPDGSDAFCGNGSRCAARFAVLNGFAGETLTLETAVGEVEARVFPEHVSVTLPAPRDDGSRTIDTPSGPVDGRRIDSGVPHFVIAVDDVDHAPLEIWAPAIRRHPSFGPPGTNVDVAVLGSTGPVRVRTWERGVEGETLSCGTGAVAVALTARIAGAGETVRIVPASGSELRVTLPGPAGRPVAAVLEGDARVILRGTLTPEGIP